MLTPNVFQILRGSTTARRYASALKEQIAQDPALQVLPSLLDLPLLPTGAIHERVATLLTHGSLIAIRGPLGSGRSLALRQIAWSWALHGRGDPLLLLSLARPDVAGANPYAILDNALRATGMSVRLADTSAAPKHSWLLLVDDWEVLPPDQQAEWRDTLVTLPQFWPGVRRLMVLPETCESWPGMQTLDLGSPDDPTVLTWLNHLLPAQAAEALYAALASRTPLGVLRNRLLDIALLALTYPRDGLPTGRVQLYGRAQAVLNDTVRAVQRPGVGGGVFRCYELACELATANDTDRLLSLAPVQRADVARLMAGMLDEPEPLYAALWGGEPSVENLQILGACLRERPNVAPMWWVRVLTALVDHKAHASCRALLRELGPLFPAVLTASGEHLPHEPVQTLLGELSPMLGGPALMALVDDLRLRAPLRWAAADALRRIASEDVRSLIGVAQPPDTVAQATRCYLLALDGPAGWEMLATPERMAWIATLQDAQVSRQHRMQVFRVLLSERGVPAALRSAVLGLSQDVGKPDTLTMLAHACLDTDASVRRSALTALRSYEPDQALQTLGHMLLSRDVPWEVQHDALRELAQYRQRDAVTVLARCLTAPTLPLAGRLDALNLLALRRVAGPMVLRRLLAVEAIHPGLRANAARFLGYLGDTQAFSELCRLAVGSVPSLVRQGAVEAIGMLGKSPEHQPRALAVLLAVLEQFYDDVTLTVCTVRALGAIGASESVAILCPLLGREAADRLKSTWKTQAPQLAELPVDKWVEASIPDNIRITLVTTLAEGTTNADNPGDFNELIEWQAARVRSAAAGALADLGRQVGGDVQQTVRTVLLGALRRVSPGPETRRLLECLVAVGADNGLSDLDSLLTDPALNPGLRWQVVDQLSRDPAAVDKLLDYLKWNLLDPFAGSKVMQILGQHGSIRALATLRRLADQSNTELHLRLQAIAALGCLSEPAAETALYHIVSDESEPAHVRSAAAGALASNPQSETRDQLRELLQRERHNSEVLAGLLHALGRLRDRASLPRMLHCAQRHDSAVVLAALNAIAEVGDASVAPILIQVAQSAVVDQTVRLHAIGTLLKLCGEEYLPLLLSYLDSDVLALRLQAFDHLLALQPDTVYIRKFIEDQTAPLALRLRAVAAAEHMRDRACLYALLLNEDDNLQLRTEVATVLGRVGDDDALDALSQCTLAAGAPLRIRYHCIAALAASAKGAHPRAVRARLALSRIADAPDQYDENRTWATHALVSDSGEWVCAVATQNKRLEAGGACGDEDHGGR